LLENPLSLLIYLIFIYSVQVDMDYEKSGSEKAIQEFLPNDSMNCIVMLKSGHLKMSGCMLSLE